MNSNFLYMGPRREQSQDEIEATLAYVRRKMAANAPKRQPTPAPRAATPTPKGGRRRMTADELERQALASERAGHAKGAAVMRAAALRMRQAGGAGARERATRGYGEVR